MFLPCQRPLDGKSNAPGEEMGPADPEVEGKIIGQSSNCIKIVLAVNPGKSTALI